MTGMKQFIACLISGLLLVQCSSTEHKRSIDVEKYQWKYGEGLHAGDWLDFTGEVYEIRNDTIYERGSAIAIISEIRKGNFGDDTEMEIVSVDGTEKGIYHKK